MSLVSFASFGVVSVWFRFVARFSFVPDVGYAFPRFPLSFFVLLHFRRWIANCESRVNDDVFASNQGVERVRGGVDSVEEVLGIDR